MSYFAALFHIRNILVDVLVGNDTTAAFGCNQLLFTATDAIVGSRCARCGATAGRKILIVIVLLKIFENNFGSL